VEDQSSHWRVEDHVKPAKFSYLRADSLDDAVSVLAEHGDEAKLLAGGQSLVPLMNMRLARPAVVIDINGLEELRTIQSNGDLSVGALVTHKTMGQAPEVERAHPILTTVVPYIGHEAIRTRGTVGGSMAHADPAAEWPDFFSTFFTTELAADEMLERVRIPARAPGDRWWFSEVTRRAGDFALTSVAILGDIEADGTCRSIRIVLGGVADVPVRAREAEQALAGQRLSDESVVREAAELATRGLNPGSDIHGSPHYKKRAAGVLVKRGLSQLANGG
jgi:aerobic carbon-monoxide dehydrogenase medium subunit